MVKSNHNGLRKKQCFNCFKVNAMRNATNIIIHQYKGRELKIEEKVRACRFCGEYFVMGKQLKKTRNAIALFESKV